MLNENVKIKINEYDTTSPSGSGIDSTDIAFVPGFSTNTNKVTLPTLCTSVKEFENKFGLTPRILTNRDVADYSSYNFISGDPDRSYVYAKELLAQGLPVIYQDITPKLYTEIRSVTAENVVVDAAFDKVLTNANDTVQLKAKNDINGEYDVTLRFTKDADATNNTTFEYCVLGESCEIKSFECKVIGTTPCDVTKLSETQFDIASCASVTNTIQFELKLKISTKLSTDESCNIVVKEATGSVLDAFYKVDSTTSKYPIQTIFSTDEDAQIADKSVYSVKYITSGGYPSITGTSNIFAQDMLNAAEYRGDAVALIDYQCDNTTRLFSVDSTTTNIYRNIHNVCVTLNNTEYGAAMYPWATYTCNTLGSKNNVVSMPASFAYLMSLAKMIKTGPNWLAVSGVTRGRVPNINKLVVNNEFVSNMIAEEMQPKYGASTQKISVNCITDINPYGLTIWGNRTLKPVSEEGTVALNFLNTRNMISDIKKVLYTTSRSLMFEQDTESLWLRFKKGVSPLLSQLKLGNGISDFKIIRGTTKYNGDPLTKGEMSAIIKIYPVHAIEYFELSVEISDEDVSVS